MKIHGRCTNKGKFVYVSKEMTQFMISNPMTQKYWAGLLGTGDGTVQMRSNILSCVGKQNDTRTSVTHGVSKQALAPRAGPIRGVPPSPPPRRASPAPRGMGKEVMSDPGEEEVPDTYASSGNGKESMVDPVEDEEDDFKVGKEPDAAEDKDDRDDAMHELEDDDMIIANLKYVPVDCNKIFDAQVALMGPGAYNEACNNMGGKDAARKFILIHAIGLKKPQTLKQKKRKVSEDRNTETSETFTRCTKGYGGAAGSGEFHLGPYQS